MGNRAIVSNRSDKCDARMEDPRCQRTRYGQGKDLPW
jgi:hypothetical protein